MTRETDIVERLRACHGIIAGDPECCCREAADEIERLRALLRETRQYVSDAGDDEDGETQKSLD